MNAAGRAGRLRHLVVVLGDQLDRGVGGLRRLRPGARPGLHGRGVRGGEQVWSQQGADRAVPLGDAPLPRRPARGAAAADHRRASTTPPSRPLGAELAKAASRQLRPGRVIVVEPGEWRVRRGARAAAGPRLPSRSAPDRHFLCSRRGVRASRAKGRRQLRMEYFYREMRRRHRRSSMEGGRPRGRRTGTSTPTNRGASARRGPGPVRPPRSPSRPTRRRARSSTSWPRRFAAHPGSLERLRLAGDARGGAARPSTTSSRTACPPSAASRTRCGPASRGSSTRASPPR